MAQVVKTLPAKAGFTGSTPTLRRSSEVENGNPLHYSYLENSMDRGVWWAIVYGISKSQTWLSMHAQKTILVWPHRVRHSCAWYKGGTSDISLKSTQRRQSFPPHTLSFDNKIIAHLILSTGLPHLSTYISCKHLILINLPFAYQFASCCSFRTEIQRLWPSLSPETRHVISVGRPWVLARLKLQPHEFKSQTGFWPSSSPGTWAQTLAHGFKSQSEVNFFTGVSLTATKYLIYLLRGWGSLMNRTDLILTHRPRYY